jgi:hypothetical protein
MLLVFASEFLRHMVSKVPERCSCEARADFVLLYTLQLQPPGQSETSILSGEYSTSALLTR